MPVAANHGAAKIMKMNDIRPSLIGVAHAPSDSITPQACSMLLQKMLRECCPLSTTEFSALCYCPRGTA
jgi:hypothetical protein